MRTSHFMAGALMLLAIESVSTLDYDMPKNRPQFVGRPGEFLHQINGAIVLLKAGKTQQVAMLRGETP